MKRTHLMAALSALVMLGYAGQAGAQTTPLMDGTPHDLVAAGSSNQLCAYCHTPHGASTTVSAPLWNRTPATAGTGYTMYSSTTLDGTLDAAGVVGVSAACLSCHDGTTPTTLNEPNDANIVHVVPTGNANFGVDLSNDHPISLTYDSVADIGLRARNGGAETVGAANLPLYQSTPTGLTRVECGSCHNPHVHGTGPTQPFLRETMDNSSLCANCHLK